MNLETINKWLDEEYGCSYTKLEELHDWLVEKNIKLRDENQQLKKQKDDVAMYIKKEIKNMPLNGCKIRLNDVLRMLGEEDKKIKKIKVLNSDDENDISSLGITLDLKTLKNKTNEIIDYLMEEK